MPDATTAATRSAFLELKDEQTLIREGYDLLDQERILIASQILIQLKEYQTFFDNYLTMNQKAMQAMASASSRLGFDTLTIYPRQVIKSCSLKRQPQVFLGVVINAASLEMETEQHSTQPIHPSPEAQLCALRFSELTKLSVELGTKAGNLRRLCAKYVQTERRAKALENVLLPEISHALKFIDEKLEEVEQEDAIRVRTRSNNSEQTPSGQP